MWRRPLWGITPCNRLARTELLPAPGAVGRRAGGAAEVGEAAESADPPTQVLHLPQWPRHPQWGRVPRGPPRPAPAPPRGAGSGPAEAVAGRGGEVVVVTARRCDTEWRLAPQFACLNIARTYHQEPSRRLRSAARALSSFRAPRIGPYTRFSRAHRCGSCIDIAHPPVSSLTTW